MTNNKGITICVDFDGTCVTHAFPNVGKDIGAVPVLKELVKKGHRLILFTMRSNVTNVPSPEFEGIFTGNYLDDAIQWFKDNDIPLYGIQVNPTQHQWTTSPKCYADIYIDDCAIGVPLIKLEEEDRPFVNWYEMRKLLTGEGIL
jgi:hypothetical protein